MAKAKGYRRASDAEKEAIFSELLSGADYPKVAQFHNTSVAMIKYWMSHFDTMRKWRGELRADPKRMKEEILRELGLGCDLLFMTELLGLNYHDLLARIHTIEREDHRYYITEAALKNTQRHITVHDVARFKEMVNVGEILVCDETEDGILIYCKILKKHTWYADTDFGGIDWNWLCVKNKRRLDGEIIYG